MKTLNVEQSVVVKETIRRIVDNKLSSIIEDSFEGNDFINQLIEELPLDFEMDFEIKQGDVLNHVDTKMYNDLLDNVTDCVYKELVFE